MNKNESRYTLWQLWIAFGLIAIGIALILKIAFPPSTLTNEEGLANPTNKPAPVVGAIAPDFALPNLNQETVHLNDFEGRPIMLNFWATWCGPCLIEMPYIQERYEKYAEEGLIILAINYAEPQKEVEAFRDELALTFEILLDPVADVERLYRVQGYPTSVFIGSDGVIQAIHIGLLSERQLDLYLSMLGFGPS